MSRLLSLPLHAIALCALVVSVATSASSNAGPPAALPSGDAAADSGDAHADAKPDGPPACRKFGQLCTKGTDCCSGVCMLRGYCE